MIEPKFKFYQNHGPDMIGVMDFGWQNGKEFDDWASTPERHYWTLMAIHFFVENSGYFSNRFRKKMIFETFEYNQALGGMEKVVLFVFKSEKGGHTWIVEGRNLDHIDDHLGKDLTI